MKTQKSWFDGSLTDGTGKLRIVGFHPHVHKKLDSLFQQQKPVHLDDCQVKESRLDDNKMDVMLKSWTEVTPSTKTIEIAKDEDEGCDPTIVLSQVEILEEFHRIKVDIKVMKVYEPVCVSGNLKKQDVIVADGSGTTKVTIWEDSIGTLQKDHCYTLQSFHIREFIGEKYIGQPRDGSAIIPITDIGQTAPAPAETQQFEIK